VLLKLVTPRQTASTDFVRLRMVFNNVCSDVRLASGWGFGCVIEGFGWPILFDTGNNGDMLLANMRQLGIAPRSIGSLVLSHLHSDHMGGLDRFLAVNPAVTLYVPASMMRPLRSMVGRETRLRGISQAQRLLTGVHSTGEVNSRGIGEQGLVLDTPDGLVLVTGCAHPGLERMVEAVSENLGRPVAAVVGGFHLREWSEGAILELIAALKSRGVAKVAPSHCTGELATALFREAWGGNFLEGGCSAMIAIGGDHGTAETAAPTIL